MDKKQKVLKLFIKYIELLVFVQTNNNKSVKYDKTVLFNRLFYFEYCSIFKQFYEHYSLMLFLLKTSMLVTSKSGKQTIKVLINRILRDNKEYIIINDKHLLLLFISFCNEHKNSFISYKKDLINFNKHNYIKKFKGINVYMINLKTDKTDINNRYYLIDSTLYNEFKQYINKSYNFCNMFNNQTIQYNKLFLLSKYNYMFVNFTNNMDYKSNKLNKSTKNYYLSELIYFIQYYNKLIKLNEYNYYIINNNSLFNHVRDYFSYYQKDNITIIEYLSLFNYNLINDISKTTNLNNTIHYKVILRKIEQHVKIDNKLREHIIYLLNKDNITFNDIQLLINHKNTMFNTKYYNIIFEKYFIRKIKI